MNTSIYQHPDYLQAATEIRESRSFSSEIFVIASSKDPARIAVSWQSDASNLRPYEQVVARFHRASIRGGDWTEERLIEEVAEQVAVAATPTLAETVAKAVAYADETFALTLPALEGTEKQSAWAEKLRGEVLVAAQRIIAEQLQRCNDALVQSADNPAMARRVRQAGMKAALWLKGYRSLVGQTSAKFWIDERSVPTDVLLESAASNG